VLPCGPARPRLARWDLRGGDRERGAAGGRGHPDSGPASAGVREFHAGRAGGGAAGGLAGHLGAAADAGDVRGGGAAAPAAGAVPGVPGAERRVRRVVLAAVRVVGPGMDISGLEEEFELSRGVAPAAVCQGAGARP
jgi:hypothetical protein